MIYVILLNWNNARDTIMCLESVLRMEYKEFRVIICDNASEAGSLNEIRAWASGEFFYQPTEDSLNNFIQPALPKPISMIELTRDEAEVFDGADFGADKLLLVHTGANLGFAGGNNVGLRLGLRLGNMDFAWILNNDTIVEPGALTALVRRASCPDRPAITGSLLCYFDQPDTIQSLAGGIYSPWRAMSRHISDGDRRSVFTTSAVQEVEASMDYVIGASMLVSRGFLEAVGLMQEDYFLYFEELDWSERGRRISEELVLGFASDSVVYHKVGASAGTNARSLASMRYLTASRMRFTKRFFPSHLLVARLFIAWEGLKALLKGRFGEAKIVLRAAFSPVLL